GRPRPRRRLPPSLSPRRPSSAAISVRSASSRTRAPSRASACIWSAENESITPPPLRQVSIPYSATVDNYNCLIIYYLPLFVRRGRENRRTVNRDRDDAAQQRTATGVSGRRTHVDGPSRHEIICRPFDTEPRQHSHACTV